MLGNVLLKDLLSGKIKIQPYLILDHNIYISCAQYSLTIHALEKKVAIQPSLLRGAVTEKHFKFTELLLSLPVLTSMDVTQMSTNFKLTCIP